jgi:DNA-3-methyladenine glycosylase
MGSTIYTYIMLRKLNEILAQPAAQVAPQILGWQLVREINGQRLVGRIVEVEAYDQADAASHSFKGPTPRTEVMFGEPGFAYVYFTYGMHWCCNIVTGPKGHGSAVLIRALEPIEGIELMKQNRNMENVHQLTNGPAKLCQAFGIDKALNKHDLTKPPLQLLDGEPVKPEEIVQTTRIGISQAIHEPWRWYIRGNPFVSKV